MNPLRDILMNAGALVFQSSVLILLLLAVEGLLRRRVRPALRHALWLLVPLKLLLPPSLALPTGLGRWIPERWYQDAPSRVVWVVRPAGPLAGPATPSPSAAPSEPSATARPADDLSAVALASAWLAGTFALLVWLGRRTWELRRVTAEATPAPATLVQALERACSRIDLRSSVRLKLVDDGQSPALCGWLHPTILLPRGLAARLTPGQLDAVLLHELLHVRRGDVWVHALQSVLQAIWWWHPLLWVTNHRLRAAREESVDDAVAFALGDDAENYPASLVEVARAALTRPVLSLGVVGIFESRNALRSRIERLLEDPPAGPPRLSFTGLLAVAAVALTLIPMAGNPQNPPPVLSRAVEIDGTAPTAPSVGEAPGRPKTDQPDLPGAVEPNILLEAHFVTVTDSALPQLGLAPEFASAAGTNSALAGQRLKELRRAALTRPEVQWLGAPRILTLSGRSAEVTSSATGSPTNFPVSISFAVLPEILPGTRRIRLNLSARITEAFDVNGLPAAERPSGGPTRREEASATESSDGTRIAPAVVGYRVQAMTNPIVVNDGEVVVMGHRVAPNPPTAGPREGLVFVKTTLVDPTKTVKDRAR